MTARLDSISGKKEVFLLPIFVSKPAQKLTLSFTHLIIAVTLRVMAVTLCVIAVTLCVIAVTLCIIAVTLCVIAVTLCVIAMTLCVIPPLCFQVQHLEYYMNLYPCVWVPRFLIKNIFFFRVGFTLTNCTKSYIPKILLSVTECSLLH